MNWYKTSQNNPTAYHGTNQDFDVFSLGLLGQDKKGHTSEEGFWFTDSIEEGQQYADYSAKRSIPNQADHNGKVQELLAKIEQLEKQQQWDLADQLTAEVEALEFGAIRAEPAGQRIIEAMLDIKKPFVVDASQEGYNQQAVIDKAKKEGYDSVIFKNISDSPQGNLTTNQYLVFSPSQITITQQSIDN